MKKKLQQLSIAALLIIMMMIVTLPLQAQPGLPSPPDQAPLWTPVIVLILGASMFAIKIMRRK